jgi:hypothetical protein
MINKILTAFFIVLGFSVSAQTNPEPQQIPYSQDFESLVHSSTNYPSGWQGWLLGGGIKPNFVTTPATSDEPINPNVHAGNNIGGVHNYNQKLGLLATGTKNPALVLAIATTGQSNVKVYYDIMTIRNPYNGDTQTKINEVTLQYRIGTSGDFVTLTGIEYQNNTQTHTVNQSTDPQNLQIRSLSLPSVCDNQPNVQLRWLVRELGGTGNRPGFAIDNVVICANAPAQPQAISGPNEICVGETIEYQTVLDPGVIGYEWTLPTGFSGTSNANSISVTANGSGGLISVVAINACGNSMARTLEVTVNELPSISLDATDSELCPGKLTTLIASGAESYTWLPGSLSGASVDVNPINTTLYTVVGVDENGCENSADIEITVFTVTTPVVMVNGTTLTSAQASSYQWNFNGNPISGAESQTYTATQTGNYSVTTISAEGCEASSAEVFVSFVGISNNREEMFKIYPNPGNGYFTIQNSKGYTLKLFDVMGRDITSKTTILDNVNNVSIDMRNFSSGVYWLQMKKSDKVHVEKIIIK